VVIKSVFRNQSLENAARPAVVKVEEDCLDRMERLSEEARWEAAAAESQLSTNQEVAIW
jgi:hypothetical protein